MKATTAALMAVGVCVLFSANATGQDGVELAADEVHYRIQDEAVTSSTETGSYSDECGCGLGLFGPLHCYEEEPRRLMPCGPLEDGMIDAYGWVDVGITFNGDRPLSNFNGILTYNDRHGELQMNQAYLVLERPVESGCGTGWDIGGRVDLLYGSDSRFVEVGGLGGWGGLGWNGHEFYGLALPQFYAEVACNNISVKMGHFYTIFGYETPMAPDNFFYSHSHAMKYGNPYTFTHTGLLASWQVTDRLTLMAGFDRGWDRFNPDPSGDHMGFLGGLVWENEGTGTKLSATCSSTYEEANPLIPGGFKDDRFFYSLVWQQQLGYRWTYVLHHDLGVQQTGSPYTGFAAEWYCVNQYLYYKLNCKLDLGVRLEMFRDDDGLRVGGYGRRVSGSPIVPFGYAGTFWDISVGANWKPTANLTIRPEVRYDSFNGINGLGFMPFNDGLDRNQWTFAIDMICEF